MAMRNPARVLPEPVGAASRTCSPAAMAGQAAAWAGVGPSVNRWRNQAAMAGCMPRPGTSVVSSVTPPSSSGSNSDAWLETTAVIAPTLDPPCDIPSAGFWVVLGLGFGPWPGSWPQNGRGGDDRGAGGAGDDAGEIVDRADGGSVAGGPHEGAGRLHLRAHRARREAVALELGGGGAVEAAGL